MNRFLQYLNFAGVLALAGLCALQWKENSRLNLAMNDLEMTRLRQSDQIAAQEKTIKGYTADLEDFRQRLTLAESQMKDLQRDLDKRTAERAQLRATLDKWVAAVTERDAALKKAGMEIQTLVKERDGAVGKFNDLAGKYNALVKDWNAAQGQR
jgi:septal ring factor EnvC (AmiA/AmiB activator)